MYILNLKKSLNLQFYIVKIIKKNCHVFSLQSQWKLSTVSGLSEVPETSHFFTSNQILVTSRRSDHMTPNQEYLVVITLFLHEYSVIMTTLLHEYSVYDVKFSSLLWHTSQRCCAAVSLCIIDDVWHITAELYIIQGLYWINQDFWGVEWEYKRHHSQTKMSLLQDLQKKLSFISTGLELRQKQTKCICLPATNVSV